MSNAVYYPTVYPDVRFSRLKRWKLTRLTEHIGLVCIKTTTIQQKTYLKNTFQIPTHLLIKVLNYWLFVQKNVIKKKKEIEKNSRGTFWELTFKSSVILKVESHQFLHSN